MTTRRKHILFLKNTRKEANLKQTGQKEMKIRKEREEEERYEDEEKGEGNTEEKTRRKEKRIMRR